MHDARRVGRLAEHRPRLVGVAPERLLADHVLSGPQRRDRRLGVERVRAAVDEQADALVGDLLAPVGHALLPAEPGASLLALGLVATRDRDEPRLERRVELPRGAERARVGIAHEGVPEHRDADDGRASTAQTRRVCRRLTVSSVTAASRIAPVTMYFVEAL